MPPPRLRLPRALRNLPPGAKLAGAAALGALACRVAGAPRLAAGAVSALLLGSAAADAGWLGDGAIAAALGRGGSSPRRNPSSLPARDTMSFAEAATVYPAEFEDALRELGEVARTLRRTPVGESTEDALREAKLLRRLVRTSARAAAAGQLVDPRPRGPNAADAEWERRARVLEAHVGAAVARDLDPHGRAWRALTRPPDATAYDAALADLAAYTDQLRAAYHRDVATGRSPLAAMEDTRKLMERVAARLGALLETRGLARSAASVRRGLADAWAAQPRALVSSELAAQFYTDFPAARARTDARRRAAAGPPTFAFDRPGPARRGGPAPVQLPLPPGPPARAYSPARDAALALRFDAPASAPRRGRTPSQLALLRPNPGRPRAAPAVVASDPVDLLRRLRAADARFSAMMSGAFPAGASPRERARAAEQTRREVAALRRAWVALPPRTREEALLATHGDPQPNPAPRVAPAAARRPLTAIAAARGA